MKLLIVLLQVLQRKAGLFPKKNGILLPITRVVITKEDRYIVTIPELFDRITGLLGGRGAEEVMFGKDNVSTGASNDFQRATAIANKMITEYGMSEKIGPTQFNGSGGDEVFL